MEPVSVQRTLVSEVLERMKKLSEEISGRTESPAEEAHRGQSLPPPTGLEVPVPTGAVDGELRNKILMQCLIFLAAVIIMPAVVLFPDMMWLVILQGIGLEDVDTLYSFWGEYRSTYKIAYGVSGIVSGILITLFNYRPVAAVGAVLTCLGCLITSFLHLENEQAVTFVFCVLPGVGNNFLYTAALVAILECFGDMRILIVLFTFFSEILVELIYEVTPLPSDNLSWRAILGIMCGIYGLCLLASSALVPLNLYMNENPRQSLRSRIMNTEALRVFKSPLLYAMGGVFLFTGIGGLDIPVILVGIWYTFASVILLSAVLFAALLAMITSCCFRKLTSDTSLVLITTLGFLMGILSLSVKWFDALPYTCIYSVLYGLGYGLREPVTRNLIPLVMGREYLGLTVGCLTFASGVGSIIEEKSTVAMESALNRVDTSFYLFGAALITSSLMVLVVIRLVKTAAGTPYQTNNEEQGVADVTQPPTTGTIDLHRENLQGV